MSRVYKCDRCGKVIRSYEIVTFDLNKYQLYRVALKFPAPKSIEFHGDLCRDCAEEIILFMKEYDDEECVPDKRQS